MSSSALNASKPAGVGEPGAHQHVLVGEGQHGPAELVGHDGPQHGVALGRAPHRRQADEHAGRAADALERAEREALQRAAVAGQGDRAPTPRPASTADPTSKRDGPSAQMSAISASSASLSAVQSLVSTSIAMRADAPGWSDRPRKALGSDPSSPAVADDSRNSNAATAITGSDASDGPGPTGGSGGERLRRRWRRARAAPAARPQPGRGLDVELVGQAQDLALAQVQEHLRLARVLAQQALELRRAAAR